MSLREAASHIDRRALFSCDRGNFSLTRACHYVLVLSMNTSALTSPLSAALTQFTYIMGKLRETIGVLAYPPLTMRGGPVPPLNADIAAIAWFRIQRAENRFRALALRFLAGKLRPSKPVLSPRPQRTTARTPNPEILPRTVFPRHFAWLLRITGGMPARHGLAHADNLRHLLAEPAMRDFLAASPRAGRVLAPSCHMLGIEKELLTPAPIPRDPHLRNPGPLGGHPGLPEHIDRNAAPGVPERSDPQPDRVQQIHDAQGDHHAAGFMERPVITERCHKQLE
jgi:hypothetical protein